MPKLKVGDTFVYTKEMNEAKKKSVWTDNADDLVGQTLTVAVVDHDFLGNLKYEAENFVFSVNNVIDPYLPETQSKKSPKRTWKTEFKSSDGIQITNDRIDLSIQGSEGAPFHIRFTETELTTLANQIRAAKLQLKKLK